MLETQISKDGKLINGIQFHVKLENIWTIQTIF